MTVCLASSQPLRKFYAIGKVPSISCIGCIPRFTHHALRFTFHALREELDIEQTV